MPSKNLDNNFNDIALLASKIQDEVSSQFSDQPADDATKETTNNQKEPDIEFIETSSEEGKEAAKAKRVSPDDEYVARRRRLVKPSCYLRSPFECHIEEADVDDEARVVASFAFDHELPRNDILYKCGKEGVFHLTRSLMSSLQENEWVDSAVIDVWANILNNREEHPNIKRICTPVIHGKYELHKVDLEKPDTRTDAEAARAFQNRLSQFNSVDWNSMDTRAIEYVMIPTIYGEHFVCYVINLQYDEFHFLSSMRSSCRKSSGGASPYEVIGHRMTREATCYISQRFAELGETCPHKWSQFRWADPQMPDQKDAASCGVFVMKFMQEWDAAPNTMPSFKKWPRNRQRQNEGVRRTTEFRMNLARDILLDETNEVKEGVYKDAIERNERLIDIVNKNSRNLV